jgi:hypothetical protein
MWRGGLRNLVDDDAIVSLTLSLSEPTATDASAKPPQHIHPVSLTILTILTILIILIIVSETDDYKVASSRPLDECSL